jgi:hypothetical protein
MKFMDSMPLLPTSFFMDCLNISKNSDEVFWAILSIVSVGLKLPDSL